MNLRLAARDAGANTSIVHLVVVQRLQIGGITRQRGEALCRPRASLPNLETLDRQSLDGRSCCERCIDIMQRVRLRQHVELPISVGMTAGDLIRALQATRDAERDRLRIRKPIRSSLKD